MARSWAEVLQQIRQQSVDLLLICLGESKNRTAVLAALTTLGQQHKVPPVLVLDQRLSQGEVSKELHQATTEPVDSLETVLRAIATQILPPSISIEELLDYIHHTLTLSNQLSAQVSASRNSSSVFNPAQKHSNQLVGMRPLY